MTARTANRCHSVPRPDLIPEPHQWWQTSVLTSLSVPCAHFFWTPGHARQRKTVTSPAELRTLPSPLMSVKRPQACHWGRLSRALRFCWFHFRAWVRIVRAEGRPADHPSPLLPPSPPPDIRHWSSGRKIKLRMRTVPLDVRSMDESAFNSSSSLVAIFN